MQIAAEVLAITREGTLPLDVRTIAREFYLFLLEQSMITEFARFEDFAAAIVYVKSGTRISHTFDSIFEHLNSLGGPFTKGSIKDDAALDFDSSTNAIQGWKYRSAAPLKSLSLMYRICLEPRRSISDETLPEQDSIFLSLAVENKKEMNLLQANSKHLSSEWHHVVFPDYSAVMTFRPLHTAVAQPELFTETMKGWIDQSHGAMSKLIRALQDQYVP
ncbi:hypothetical protein ABIA06_003157 [Bradyrhizobium yuanmingense]|uniref:hypothetical protein n=1 Tax=Bradyrhizobium yuanmingense TaxID=108015 RepID=UPI003516373E